MKIQGFFIAYRLRKQQSLQEAISTSPAIQLLQALDLRFQCMRAVAAAKLPIAKPIEDRTQVMRVIERAQALARERGIVNLEAVANPFLQNITLAENIQSPYYHLIWTKCHDGERDLSRLVNNAYRQLREPILTHELSIVCNHEKKLLLHRKRYLCSHVTLFNMLAERLLKHWQTQIYESTTKAHKKILKELLNKCYPTI